MTRTTDISIADGAKRMTEDDIWEKSTEWGKIVVARLAFIHLRTKSYTQPLSHGY